MLKDTAKSLFVELDFDAPFATADAEGWYRLLDRPAGAPAVAVRLTGGAAVRGGELRLTDARFSKADVLLVLKTVRKDMDKTMEDAHDEIQATMGDFAQTVLSFGQDMRAHAQRLLEIS